MIVTLIRHGKTFGNTLGRYIGITDEPLCEAGIEDLLAKKERESHPSIPDLLFVSPMLRCRKTAELLFPGREQIVCDSLKECDFGLFENKNYKELSGVPQYQAWIDSMGTMDFPDGEKTETFRSRCREGFVKAMEEAVRRKSEETVFVVHGGTIMAVCEAFALPKKDYFSWQIKNGNRLSFTFDEEAFRKKERFLVLVQE